MLLESTANLHGANQKEHLRNAIKYIFDLESKDIIIFKQNEIFIKRWGGAALVQPQFIEKIKELFEKESSKEGVGDNVTIGVKEELEKYGLTSENLTNELKDKIRQKIKESLRLSDKDVVLFLNDKVVIKKFKMSPEEEERLRKEQLRSSLTKESLTALKRSIFHDTESEKESIEHLMARLLSSDLNFKLVTFDYFAANYVKVLQSSMVEFLREYLSDEEDVVVEVLASFMLKENWTMLHKQMALSLLNLVSEKDPNAEAFLKRYSGEVEVDEHRNKFRMPEILDKNGSKWHISTILSIVMQRIKIHDTTISRQNLINGLKEQITDLSAQYATLKEESDGIKKELEIIDNENKALTKNEAELEKEIKDLNIEALTNPNEDDKKKIQSLVREKSLALKKLTTREDALYENKKKFEIQNKLNSGEREKVKFDLGRFEKRLKEEEDKIRKFYASQKELDEKFESIKDALAGALTKRGIKV